MRKHKKNVEDATYKSCRYIREDRRYSVNSISRRMRSRTSRSPPPSRRTRLGDRARSSSALSSLPRILPGLLGVFVGVSGTSALDAGCVGISSQSSPPISSLRRKKGQSLTSRSSDSYASAVDKGTGEDLMILSTTVGVGNVRRLREEGVAVTAPDGLEKSIHTLSATPSSLPRRHRRRIASFPN